MKHAIALIALVAVVAAGALYFVRVTHDRQVLELERHVQQAQAQRAAMEAAAAEAKAMAEKAAAERAAAEQAAAQANAIVKKLAAERAAAEKAATEARAMLEKAAAERAAAEERRAAERAAAERGAAEARAKALEERSPLRPDPQTLYDQAAALELAGKGLEAVKMYIRAARSGHGKAALRLGEIFDKGIPGVSRDYPESLKWYNAARVLGEDVPIWKGR